MTDGMVITCLAFSIGSLELLFVPLYDKQFTEKIFYSNEDIIAEIFEN